MMRVQPYETQIEMTFLIGTDIGTLGTKTVVVDVEGRVRASTFQEYGVLNPQPGWAEQWPGVWAEAVSDTMRSAIQISGVDPADIAGACISSLYGGSGIPVDREGEPIRPCIIWADRRSTRECQWVREEIGVDEMFRATGNVIDPYYGYTKMLWIRQHEPRNWERIQRLVTPNAYCIQLLTGEESIDLSSAGNYGGIFDIHGRIWSEEMMKELGILRAFFPEKIVSSEEVVGEVTSEGSRATGLRRGTPVCAGGIDAPMSALAGGAILDGDLASMLGTSMCNGFISHTPRLSPRLVNFPYVVKGREITYSFTGVVTAGYCVRWFRDELGHAESERAEAASADAYGLLDEGAEKVPSGSDGLIFLPHLMIGERAPYWDEHLRGGFLGLTVSHTRTHMFRAVLEGVAYAMRYSIEAAREAGLSINRATLVDGGARSPLWRQIIADVTGLGMDYIPDAKGAPLGDAILAGLGTGVLRDHGVIEEWLGEKVRIKPDVTSHQIYNRCYGLYKLALEQNRALFEKMGELGG
jgi:sugar (pentulose or hexulose) kinase